jgi:hypothetical protein
MTRGVKGAVPIILDIIDEKKIFNKKHFLAKNIFNKTVLMKMSEGQKNIVYFLQLIFEIKSAFVIGCNPVLSVPKLTQIKKIM